MSPTETTSNKSDLPALPDITAHLKAASQNLNKQQKQTDNKISPEKPKPQANDSKSSIQTESKPKKQALSLAQYKKISKDRPPPPPAVKRPLCDDSDRGDNKRSKPDIAVAEGSSTEPAETTERKPEAHTADIHGTLSLSDSFDLSFASSHDDILESSRADDRRVSDDNRSVDTSSKSPGRSELDMSRRRQRNDAAKSIDKVSSSTPITEHSRNSDGCRHSKDRACKLCVKPKSASKHTFESKENVAADSETDECRHSPNKSCRRCQGKVMKSADQISKSTQESPSRRIKVLPNASSMLVTCKVERNLTPDLTNGTHDSDKSLEVNLHEEAKNLSPCRHASFKTCRRCKPAKLQSKSTPRQKGEAELSTSSANSSSSSDKSRRELRPEKVKRTRSKSPATKRSGDSLGYTKSEDGGSKSPCRHDHRSVCRKCKPVNPPVKLSPKKNDPKNNSITSRNPPTTSRSNPKLSCEGKAAKPDTLSSKSNRSIDNENRKSEIVTDENSTSPCRHEAGKKCRRCEYKSPQRQMRSLAQQSRDNSGSVTREDNSASDSKRSRSPLIVKDLREKQKRVDTAARGSESPCRHEKGKRCRKCRIRSPGRKPRTLGQVLPAALDKQESSHRLRSPVQAKQESSGRSRSPVRSGRDLKDAPKHKQSLSDRSEPDGKNIPRTLSPCRHDKKKSCRKCWSLPTSQSRADSKDKTGDRRSHDRQPSNERGRHRPNRNEASSRKHGKESSPTRMSNRLSSSRRSDSRSRRGKERSHDSARSQSSSSSQPDLRDKLKSSTSSSAPKQDSSGQRAAIERDRRERPERSRSIERRRRSRDITR